MDKDLETSKREWIAAWEQIEGLARDAARWYETCGDSCGIISLAEWRQRVLALVHAGLLSEHETFDALQAACRETPDAPA